MKMSQQLRTEIAQTILARLSSGSSSLPRIQMYEGTIPSTMGSAINDTLLAELELTAAVGTENNGVVNFGDIADDPEADAVGVAGWALILDGDGSEVVYMTVSDEDGDGELKLNNVNIVPGVPVSISSAIIQVGG